MAQSKQELATRNAKIRAEKLRENLAKRKQQIRERKVVALESATDESQRRQDNEKALDQKTLG